MSLSDYIKYLRAVGGGLTPWEIGDKSGVPAREIHLIEVKHRRVGENEEMLQKLAGFFDVPLDELKRRREAYRKRLTFFLEESQEHSTPVTLRLESGEDVEGTVAWFGREAVALTPADGGGDDLCVVQRGWVADWRNADSKRWEISSAL